MTRNSIMESSQDCLYNQSLYEVAELFLTFDTDEMRVLTQDMIPAGWIGRKQLYQVMANRCSLEKTIEQLVEEGVIVLTKNAPQDQAGQNRPSVDAESDPSGQKPSHNLDPITLYKQWESVIESIHNGLVAIDKDKKIIIFNHSAERMFGKKKEQVIGRAYSDIFPDGNLDEVIYTEQAAPAVKVVYENKILLSNRTPMIADGKLVGAIAVSQDISELEQISQELEYTRKLQTELEGIIEASFDSLVVTDDQGNILKINQSYSRWSGIDRDELIGRNMYDLVDEGMYDRSAAALVIEKQAQVTFTQHVKKTGKVLLVTGTPVFDEEGKLVRVVINVRDVTELNKLKIEVEQAQILSKHFEEQLQKASRSGDMIIASPKLKEVMELVERLGKVDSTILVYGESGVGKELIAKELLKFCPRTDKPFIVINCAAIPESLLESELFGYESGTFSGAKKGGKMGIFEAANGGTLFLDEIGEMPLLLQAKLLRVIQEKEVTRIGSSVPIPVDVRIIAATNRNLWAMVQTGEFREDLYYRLSVVPVFVPPLRDRKEDIPALVAYFVGMINKKYDMNKSIDHRLLDQLVAYHWPGNVRELKNAIERAVVTSIDDVIISIKVGGNGPDDDNNEVIFSLESNFKAGINFKETVESYEKTLLERYIKIHKTSRKVAKALGMSQSKVVRKAAYYGISLNSD